MKPFRLILSSVALVSLAPPTLAQFDTPKTQAQPQMSQVASLITFNKFVYAGVNGILLRSAEKMPEENYTFKPTDAVRSDDQIIGQVADAQYLFCSMALGEKNPSPNIEQTKSSKSDLVNNLHSIEHYGNLVTYMRLKNIVPPTSEPGAMPQSKP